MPHWQGAHGRTSQKPLLFGRVSVTAPIEAQRLFSSPTVCTELTKMFLICWKIKLEEIFVTIDIGLFGEHGYVIVLFGLLLSVKTVHYII